MYGKNEESFDILKYMQNFDEDFKMSDYTPEEIYEMIHKNETEKFKDNYFSKYDDVKSSSLKKQDW